MAINLIDSDDITVSQSGANIELNTATSISEIMSEIDNLKPTVLYSNSGGSDNINLSDSANNYSRFIINCGIAGTSSYKDFVVENTGTSKILDIKDGANNGVGSTLTINGNTMTLTVLYRNYYVTATILIYKVLGFK